MVRELCVQREIERDGAHVLSAHVGVGRTKGVSLGVLASWSTACWLAALCWMSGMNTKGVFLWGEHERVDGDGDPRVAVRVRVRVHPPPLTTPAVG